MNRAIAAEHQYWRPLHRELEAFRQHLEKCGGHHESRAESDKVAQVALLPIAAHQHQTAEDVGERCDASEDERELHQSVQKGSNVQFTEELRDGLTAKARDQIKEQREENADHDRTCQREVKGEALTAIGDIAGQTSKGDANSAQ